MPSKHRVKITVDGKAYWVGGKTEKEARKRAEAKRAKLEDGARTIRKNMLVKDWAEEWVKTYKEGVINDNNVRDYRSIIKIYINPAIGHMRVQDVRSHDINKILQEAAETKSSAHVKRIRETCNQIFREAYNSDLTLVDVEKGVKRYKGTPPTQRRAITPRERELTLKVAKTHFGGLFVLIMLYAGLRPGEVAALKWNHVDMEKRIIYVKDAVKTTGEVGEPKSDAGVRAVPISLPLYNRLMRENHGPFDFVCTDANGKQFSKDSIRRMWQSFKKEMNIAAGCKTMKPKYSKHLVLVPPLVVTDLVLYDYRHTFGSDCQDAGIALNVTRELMGHVDIRTTALTYTHLSNIAFDEAADKLDSLHEKDNGKE